MPSSRPCPQTCLGTGSVDGPSVLMEGVRGQHEHKEENKGWFAILLLQLPQPYAATCDSISLIRGGARNPPTTGLEPAKGG